MMRKATTKAVTKAVIEPRDYSEPYEYASSTDSEEDEDSDQFIQTNTEIDPETVTDDLDMFGNVDEGKKTKKNKGNKCLIFSNNQYKIGWDLFVSVLLLIVCVVVPYRITFVVDEDPDVEMAFNLFDIMFAIDMIASFFTTIPDEENMSEITDRKIIAFDYLTSWFPIDLVSILPIGAIMSLFAP